MPRDPGEEARDREEQLFQASCGLIPRAAASAGLSRSAIMPLPSGERTITVMITTLVTIAIASTTQ